MSSVTTNAATNIGVNSAQLNGSYSGAGGYLSFVWGYSSGNLAYQTGNYSGNGSGGSWYWNIGSLPASTTIYFQAQGYSYGSGSIRSSPRWQPPTHRVSQRRARPRSRPPPP